MTAPDPMPLVERLRACPFFVLRDLMYGAADEIERLTAALEAEKAEVFRLQASHSALYAEVEALRDTLAQVKGVPKGWKLVPVEPTREMLEASDSHCHDDLLYPQDMLLGPRAMRTTEYIAMLTATPPSPAQASGWRDTPEKS